SSASTAMNSLMNCRQISSRSPPPELYRTTRLVADRASSAVSSGPSTCARRAEPRSDAVDSAKVPPVDAVALGPPQPIDEIEIEQFLGDRSGRAAAAAAVLDHHRKCDQGFVDRREGDEQCVVAQ